MLILWRIILLVAIWLFFESVISWAAFCRHQNEYSSIDQTAESYECVFRVASIARWLAGWWVHAFDKADAYIALFTAVLAIGTLALWWSTRKLWNVTRIEAEHIPRVERAYISGGATGLEGSPQQFAVTVDNYGKTPAFIGTIWANIVPENELPDIPVYDPPEFGWFGGQMLKPDTSGHPVVTRQWDVIEGRVTFSSNAIRRASSCASLAPE